MTVTMQVSVGLPVYNGERYLVEAIESILAQTYRDFELIISDNASTDRTQQICQDFAGRDQRIRYHRQPSNKGAAANFNCCVELAKGRYFKWAAHDDLLEPGFLEACVQALQKDPDAVLAQSLVKIVDDSGRELETYDHAAWGSGAAELGRRFAGRLRASRCLEVFGLIRTEVLRETVLIGQYAGSDRTLLIDLVLRGRFALVPEPLLINRDHPRRSTRVTRKQDRSELAAWYDSRRTRRSVFRVWIFYGTCFRLIRRNVGSYVSAVSCYRSLIASVRLRHNLVFLLLEPLMALDPRVLTIVKSARRKFTEGMRSGSEA